MEKSYKAIQYKVTIHHDEVIDKDEPWNNSPAYDTVEMRYRIVSTDTGETLDDAQGYGYKTAQNAYSSYAYKIRDKSKDKARVAKQKHIEQWMEKNETFVNLMDECAFQIAKGTMAPDDKFDTRYVAKLLKAQGIETDFTANELLRVWRKRNI